MCSSICALQYHSICALQYYCIGVLQYLCGIVSVLQYYAIGVLRYWFVTVKGFLEYWFVSVPMCGVAVLLYWCEVHWWGMVLY